MNVMLFTSEDIVTEYSGTRFRVQFTDSRKLDHIQKILKSSKGDILRVGLLNGHLGEGVICQITAQKVLLDVDLNTAPPLPSPLTLLLALPRPLVVRRILADVTSFGVKRICLFQSKRVEKSFWQSPVLEEPAITAQLIKGLEQGRDSVMPIVEKYPDFQEILSHEMMASIKGAAAEQDAYLAQPGAAQHLPERITKPTLITIGPEGGLLAREVSDLQDRGFQPVSLGPRLLRVETSVSAVMGRLGIP